MCLPTIINNMTAKPIFLFTVVFFLFIFQTVFSQHVVLKDTIGTKDSVSQKLSAVEVKGHRTYVKAVDGKLQYLVAPMIKDKAIDNAFEVLKQIPGLIVLGDKVSIAGASQTNIIINNRLTSMTLEQVVEMLKSTPSGKVKKVEVMYSTPPQYGVHGASVNIVMVNDKSLKDVLKGEILLKGQQAWYFTPSARVTMSYATQKLSTDFSYSGNLYHFRSQDDMQAYQTLNQKDYTIGQHNQGGSVVPAHRFRAVLEYETMDSSQITLSYNGSFDRTDSRRNAQTAFSEIGTYSTSNHITGPSAMHSFRLDYAGVRGLKAGCDYVYYSDHCNQDLLTTTAGNLLYESVSNYSTQRVDRESFYINSLLRPIVGWQINYGLNASLSRTHNGSATMKDALIDEGASYQQIQKEQNSDIFANVSKSFGEKVSLHASLSLQYYRAVADSAKTERTLWKRLDVFPTLVCSYNPNADHTLQFSCSANKTYPSYFQTAPALVYLNAYSVTQGNPQLTPSRTYSGSLNYTLMRKYMLTFFLNYESGCIQQMPYQSADMLRLNFIQINMDYRNTYGVTGELPFKIGKVLESKFDATVSKMHDKGLLKEIAFDRSKMYGLFDMDNTIYLNKKQNLFFNLTGSYTTSIIQGVYSIDPVFDITGAIVWNFAQDKARLTLKADDVFNGQSLNTRVFIANQQSTLYLFSDSRAITLSFRYNFSDYKKKDLKEVDTSRFGTNL